MVIPQVALVGRPNVGKSSLLNWLAGRRIAIVDATAGTTRDRVSALIATEAGAFELVDTGGMGLPDHDQLTAEVERQIALAIEEAALLLFVVDVRAGLTPLDQRVAERLRGVGKPLLCVANKCDTPAWEPQAAEFYRLGCGEVLPVSAHQGRGKAALLDWIVTHLPAVAAAPPQPALHLAIVGRRNTGKSTFINCLAQAERVIVSEVPGTTRDSVDVRFYRDGQVFVAIDTAGVRRKKSIANDIEFYSLARAERSIRRADVVLHFYDPQFPVSRVDKQLVHYVLEHTKPMIFVVNKWDLMKGKIPTGEFADYLHRVFPSLDYVPVAFITAKTGKNVQAVLNLAQNLHKQASARVGTSDLNRVVQQALAAQAPPLRHNRRAKIYYATQVAANPPTLVLFTNDPELLDKAYQRYLVNYFREHLPFREVPLRLYLRARTPSADKKDPPSAEATIEQQIPPKTTPGRGSEDPVCWQE